MPGGVNLGSAHGNIIIDHGQATAGINQVQRGLFGLQSGFLGLNPIMLATGAGLAGLGVAATGFVAGIGKSIKTATSFEETLSGVKAVMQATDDQLVQLKSLAKDLGVDPKLTISAKEAAQAMEVLGRNGLKVQDILDGAARATILLSNSTGGDLALSADVATDAMSLFNIEAKDMEGAVDGITSVVNNSKFSIQDYQYALASAGGTANSTGVSFDDFNTAIAAIAPSFASGRTAGTAFKVFLQRLIPSSDKAYGAMQDLGLITADGANQFFDASGNMKDMAEIAGILQNALGDLSEEQRLQALTTIFGSEASNVAVGLAKTGEEAFRNLQETMGNTSAAEAAATRVDNLAGSMKILKSIIETLQIGIGDAFIPVVRKLVDALSAFLSSNADSIVGFFEFLAEKADAGVDTFLKYAPAVLAFGKYIAFVVRHGDELNDWITELPKPVQGFVIKIGEAINKVRDFIGQIEQGAGKIKSFGRSLQGSFNVAGFAGVRTFLTQEAEKLGQFLGKVIKGGVQYVFDNKQEVGELLTGFIGTLARAIPGIIRDIRATGTEVAAGFIKGFVEGISGTQLSDDTAKAIASGLSTLTLLLPILTPLLGGLPGLLLAAAGGLAAFAAQSPEVREFFSGLATDAQELFNTLTSGEGPLADFTERARGAIGELGSVAGSVQQFIADLQTAFQEGGLSGLTDVFWSWVDGPEGIIASAPTNINQILDIINRLLEEGRTVWMPALDRWGDEFWNWISTIVIPQGAAQLSGISQTVSDWANSPEGRERLRELGRQVALSLYAGMEEVWTNRERLVNLLKALITGAVEAAPAAAGAFFDVGREVAGGFLGGFIEFITGSEPSEALVTYLGTLWQSVIQTIISTIIPGASLAFAKAQFDELLAAFQETEFGEIGTTVGQNIADGLHAAVDIIGQAVGEIVDQFNPLQKIQLPSFLQRHSPSPLEQTFMGLNDLLSKMPSIPDTLGLNAMPALATVAPGGAPAPAFTPGGRDDPRLPPIEIIINGAGDPNAVADKVDQRLRELFGKSYKPR